MMKTLKKKDEFKRVKDSLDIIKKLLEDGWNFAPKSEWKNATRKKKEEIEKNKKITKRGKNS